MYALELVGERAVRLALEDVVLVHGLLQEVRPCVEARRGLVVLRGDRRRPRARLEHLHV